ncbi:hypothetical protein EHV15_35735 [Paenibacillus oralis]|uniref:Uncharacterized protein n=1 Tax=Paenibacillus oralis TaxID=2490856 RepID=A0A3P3TA44_9BACL|nr:hypothetical protein [Paenibacillus oralis]RRJ54925.1 hypothetical protein EHV15_35735 [Paenibacillus oralis]
MSKEISIGSKIKEVHMKLEPSGFAEPIIIDLMVQFVDSETINFGVIRHKTFYRPSEINLVQSRPEFPDSLQQIRRFGICREEDLEAFKLKMMNNMHDALVGYRDGLRSMQEHLNAQLPQEVDNSIAIDWEEFRCTAISDSSQTVSPDVEEDDMDWNSTEEVTQSQYVEIEDLTLNIVVYARGLEGLEGAALINRMKRAIREEESIPKFIIVSDEGFWKEIGWCSSKADATRFVHQISELPTGLGVKLIPESKQHSFTDAEGNQITE